MGIWNPLTFGRKARTATNALLASYSFGELNIAEIQLAMTFAMELAPHWFQEGWQRKLEDAHGRIVFLNLFALGMIAADMKPRLGDELWFEVHNPFVECIGAEEVLPTIKKQLEQKYRISLSDILTEHPFDPRTIAQSGPRLEVNVRDNAQTRKQERNPIPQVAVRATVGPDSAISHNSTTHKQEGNTAPKTQAKGTCPHCGGPGSNGMCWSCGARW